MIGRAWLLISLFILIMALALDEPPLLIIAILFFLTSAIGRIWARYALKRFEFNSKISSEKVFFGEGIYLEISVTNNKFIPLPWVRIEYDLPDSLNFQNSISNTSPFPNRKNLTLLLSLNWYHKLTRRYHTLCSQRGYYMLGPVSIKTGDPFGFFTGDKKLENTLYLTVYPLILPLEELSIPSRNPFGEIKIRKHLFTDPVQVRSTREYVYGDPLRHIHWKSSARTQKLQTKVFEYTTTMDIAIFLDTRSSWLTYYWNIVNPPLLETAIITATSITADSLNKGFKTGVFVNEFYVDSHRLIKHLPSNHPDQLKHILESMAQLKGISSTTIEDLISSEIREIPWETTVVVITPVLTDKLINILSRLSSRGRKISLILIGSYSDKHMVPDNIQTYYISEDIYTNRQQSVMLGSDNTGELNS